MFNLLSNPCRMCRTTNCVERDRTKREIDKLINQFPHLSVYCKNHISTLSSYQEENISRGEYTL